MSKPSKNKRLNDYLVVMQEWKKDDSHFRRTMRAPKMKTLTSPLMMASTWLTRQPSSAAASPSAYSMVELRTSHLKNIATRTSRTRNPMLIIIDLNIMITSRGKVTINGPSTRAGTSGPSKTNTASRGFSWRSWASHWKRHHS